MLGTPAYAEVKKVTEDNKNDMIKQLITRFQTNLPNDGDDGK